jgi:hypothetical protein
MDYSALVRKYAQLYGVDQALIQKVIAAESGGDRNAVSPKGARGLMQLMPATAAELGITDPHDPEQSIRGGTQYLAQLLEKFPDQRTAVAAFNFGPGNVSAGKAWPKETNDYVTKVLGPLSVRIGGQAYGVGDVVQGRGRHAGKTVTSIGEAGIPTLIRRPDARGLAGLVADPDFAAFPLEERVAALKKVGASPEFIQSYAAPTVPSVPAAAGAVSTPAPPIGPTYEEVTANPLFAHYPLDAQARILNRLVGPGAAVGHLLGVMPTPTP